MPFTRNNNLPASNGGSAIHHKGCVSLGAKDDLITVNLVVTQDGRAICDVDYSYCPHTKPPSKKKLFKMIEEELELHRKAVAMMERFLQVARS